MPIHAMRRHRPTGARARSAGSARSRSAGGPSTGAAGTTRGAGPNGARDERTIRGPRDPRDEGPARLYRRQEVAEHRIEQRLVPDECRPKPPACAAVAVSERVAIRAEVQPSVAILLTQEAVVVRMLEAQQLAVERVDRAREPAMAVAVRARHDLLERDSGDAARELGKRLRSLDVADQAEQRRPGHDPVQRVEGVRDRLCAVGHGCARHPVAVGGQHVAQQIAPQPLGLRLREHEQHRQEPHALTDGGDREANDPFSARGAGSSRVATTKRSGSVECRWR